MGVIVKGGQGRGDVTERDVDNACAVIAYLAAAFSGAAVATFAWWMVGC